MPIRYIALISAFVSPATAVIGRGEQSENFYIGCPRDARLLVLDRLKPLRTAVMLEGFWGGPWLRTQDAEGLDSPVESLIVVMIFMKFQSFMKFQFLWIFSFYEISDFMKSQFFIKF